MTQRLPTKSDIAAALNDTETKGHSFAAIVDFVDRLREFACENNVALDVPSGALQEELFGTKNFTIDSVLVVVDGQRNGRSISLYTPFGEVRALARDLSDAATNKIIAALLAQKDVALQPPIFVFNNGDVQHDKWTEPYKGVRTYALWQTTTQRFGAGLVVSHLPSALRNATKSALCAHIFTQRPTSNQ